MEISNSLISEEIKAIFEGNPRPVNHTWKCTFFAGDDSIVPFKILSIDNDGDYVDGYGDIVMLEVLMSDDDFNNLVVKNKDVLTVELIKYPVKERESVSPEDKIVSRVYKAMPKDGTNDFITASYHDVRHEPTENIGSIEKRVFQLLEGSVEKLRTITVGGVFKNNVPADVVNYLLTDVCSKLNSSLKYPIKGVDMVEADNKKTNEHVVIPHGTSVIDLASLVQQDWGGIYSTGIGSYIKDSMWYIWPQYNTNRYSKQQSGLRIYNLPENYYPGVERTYRENGKEVILLSTGQSVFMDNSFNEKMEYGNGVRFTSASSIMDGFGTVDNTKDNKLSVQRHVNNSEFKAVLWKDTDFIPFSKTRITDNPFFEHSKISRREGSFVQITWENSNSDLLYPGMPVSFHYLENEKVMSLTGVLIKSHSYVENLSDSSVNFNYVENTMLTIFIKRIKEWVG